MSSTETFDWKNAIGSGLLLSRLHRCIHHACALACVFVGKKKSTKKIGQFYPYVCFLFLFTWTGRYLWKADTTWLSKQAKCLLILRIILVKQKMTLTSCFIFLTTMFTLYKVQEPLESDYIRSTVHRDI